MPDRQSIWIKRKGPSAGGHAEAALLQGAGAGRPGTAPTNRQIRDCSSAIKFATGVQKRTSPLPIRNASCPAEADADHVKLKTEMLQLRLMEKKRAFLPPIKKRLIWAKSSYAGQR